METKTEPPSALSPLCIRAGEPAIKQYEREND